MMMPPPPPQDADYWLPEEPSIPHAELCDAGGRPLKFFKVLQEMCPACGVPSIGLYHRAEPGESETVGCLKCHWMVSRKRVVQGRRLPTLPQPPPDEVEAWAAEKAPTQAESRVEQPVTPVNAWPSEEAKHAAIGLLLQTATDVTRDVLLALDARPAAEWGTNCWLLYRTMRAMV